MKNARTSNRPARWSTPQLVNMSLMCALSAVLSFIQIPLIPAAPFLTYDPSLVPALVCGLSFGPAAGIAVGSIAAIIHGLMLGEWVGSLMNIVVAVAFIAPATTLYRSKRSLSSLAAGLAISIVVTAIAAIAANLTIGVAFWYGSADVILPLVVPALVPFNLIKGALNAAIAFGAFKVLPRPADGR